VTSFVATACRFYERILSHKGWNLVSDMSPPRPTPTPYRRVYCNYICRALVHYKGSPDPFKGDLLNQKVRDTAKEAVEAMFAPTETPSYSQTPSSIQVKIQPILRQSKQPSAHSSFCKVEVIVDFLGPPDVLVALNFQS
jgi:hypothetical protein